ncbi:MAG: hypothetical protein LCH39_01265 [Proteobacteria bacterium]|nr:hypothetical protein [Pseudomonadota bacterium]
MTERLRAIITHSNSNPNRASEFFRFRKSLFVDQLGWQLEVSADEERDQFDTSRAVYALIVRGQKIVGGFRALRTDGPYLAEHIFPQLAVDRPYPKSIDVWEISRFGVEPGADQRRLAQINYGLMFRFAFYQQARALVAIADLTYERYLATVGIRTKRYGPPTEIPLNGTSEPLAILAGEIPICGQDGARFRRLVSSINAMEVSDETLAFRHVAVSA